MVNAFEVQGYIYDGQAFCAGHATESIKRFGRAIYADNERLDDMVCVECGETLEIW